MSEAPSHASAGSQGSLRLDDSISQIMPPYFTDNTGYRYDMDIDDDACAPSEILSSAPPNLLTPTIYTDSAPSRSTSGSQTHQFRHNPLVPSFPTDISSDCLSVPASFLPQKKSRKGHCWFPANAIGFWRMGNGGGNVHGVCILEYSASIQKNLQVPYNRC